jgi:hypothetical protein
MQQRSENSLAPGMPLPRRIRSTRPRGSRDFGLRAALALLALAAASGCGISRQALYDEIVMHRRPILVHVQDVAVTFPDRMAPAGPGPHARVPYSAFEPPPGAFFDVMRKSFGVNGVHRIAFVPCARGEDGSVKESWEGLDGNLVFQLRTSARYLDCPEGRMQLTVEVELAAFVVAGSALDPLDRSAFSGTTLSESLCSVSSRPFAAPASGGDREALLSSCPPDSLRKELVQAVLAGARSLAASILGAAPRETGSSPGAAAGRVPQVYPQPGALGAPAGESRVSTSIGALSSAEIAQLVYGGRFEAGSAAEDRNAFLLVNFERPEGTDGGGDALLGFIPRGGGQVQRPCAASVDGGSVYSDRVEEALARRAELRAGISIAFQVPRGAWDGYLQVGRELVRLDTERGTGQVQLHGVQGLTPEDLVRPDPAGRSASPAETGARPEAGDFPGAPWYAWCFSSFANLAVPGVGNLFIGSDAATQQGYTHLYLEVGGLGIVGFGLLRWGTGRSVEDRLCGGAIMAIGCGLLLLHRVECFFETYYWLWRAESDQRQEAGGVKVSLYVNPVKLETGASVALRF